MTDTLPTFYKATAPDGFDFYSHTIDYASAVGGTVKVPSPKAKSYSCCSSDVLHASDTPTETLIGGSWPCRLFEVTGKPVAQEGHKHGFRKLTVVREIDAHLALGPQGKQIADLIERARKLKRGEIDDLSAARNAEGNAAWYAAWSAARNAAGNAARNAAGNAAWDAAGNAARNAAGNAARNAAGALAVRDLVGQHGFTQAHYDLLTKPWAQVVGKVHPDD